MWLLTTCLGFVLEIIGLACAARGLWRTWRDNAQGRSFFSPRVTGALGWIRVRLLRREPITVTGQAIGIMPSFEMSAAGYALQGLSDTMSLDAKIEAVQANALNALD